MLQPEIPKNYLFIRDWLEHTNPYEALKNVSMVRF